MKRVTHRLMAIVVLGLFALQLSAQTKAYMFGLGRTNLLDTYLSPQNYYGTDLRYVAHKISEKDSTNLQHRQLFTGEISLTKPKSEDGKQISGMVYYSYAWLWPILNTHIANGKFRMHAGGAVDVMLGFIYNTRNGNNPAQAKLALNLSPVINADYHIPNTKLVLNYEASAPLVGLMFSPNYGQSYYEIFSRGNYDHNIVPTTIGATPTLRHLLTLDFPLFNKTFRVGYMGDYQQAKVNNLKYHARTHSFVIGMVF